MGKGFGTGKFKKGKQAQKTYWLFLLEVLQVTADSGGDQQVVYPLLAANLDKLDNNFARVLQSWATAWLSKVEREQAQSIAATIGLFSNLLVEFPLGVCADNLEIAIAGYEIISPVFTREACPEEWADQQVNVGIAYNNRIEGDRAENSELALTHFQSALQVFTRKAYPEEWAGIQSNLGVAYSNQLKGERAENLELAITYFRDALQVCTYEIFSEQWADIQVNLGSVYQQRIKGNQAENLELAIACFRDALQIRTQQAFPRKWATLQNNLGVTYSNRIKRDRAENLELALTYFQASLQVRTEFVFPEDWAGTQINLGNTYQERIQGNQAQNQEWALTCYQSALRVFTRKAFPQKWAMCKIALGNVYQNWSEGDLAENLDMAITAYKSALQICTYEKFPEQWAMIQGNLGNAYRNRIRHNRADNLALSATAFEAALQVCTRKAFPQNWARNQNNLGMTYRRQGQTEKAITCFRSAREVFTPAAFPIECLHSGRNFADTAFAAGLWAEAIEGYGFAIEAVETSRSWVNSEPRRQEILAESIDVYEKIVQACINAGQLTKAIEYVERSRSKRLIDLMASNDLYSDGEIRPEVSDLLQKHENLQQQIDQERSQNTSNNRELNRVERRTADRASSQAYNATIKALEIEKQQIWDQLRRLDPVLAGEIKVDAPNFAAMQQLIDQPTTAILSCYTTQNDTHIFILRKDKITLHSCKGQGLESLQSWVFQNWLLSYVSDRNTWKSQINGFLTELAERLQLPQLIYQYLEGIEELILVPHLSLHQIPFAALPIGDGQFFGDKFLIRYTPSCQVLEFCSNRESLRNSLTYGTVEDATDDLPFASFEGEHIAKAYNITETNRLRGRAQATKSNYHQLTKRVQVLHSCHHAKSRLDNPLESKLELGDGDITLGQLMTPGWRLPNLSDVFLSCCETGLGVTPVTDDILTLSTGFLCAGARNVVSTLWSVNDLATALFSIFYYQHRQQGKNRPESLQQAQINLRELKKEEFLKREDIQELYRQASVKEKEARINRKRYPQGSVERLKWDREYIKYSKLINPIDVIQDSQEECPFSHPCDWAAFTCSGLS